MAMRGIKETMEIAYETYCDEPNSSKPSNGDKDQKITKSATSYLALIIVT